MADESGLETFMRLLKNLRGKDGKERSYAGFEESLTILQDEAATKGVQNHDMRIIVDFIINTSLRAGLCVPLIKCLIPRKKVDDKIVEDMIVFWLAKCNELPITVSTVILQWLSGLWEYQLVDKQSINIYYDCFFYVMLKKERLESSIAKLVYLLTKPDDVTRRQVTRLLGLQQRYAKPQKHISALLSLFKSYKPELVPERIPALNIESVWKPIPEVLRLGFEDAKTRGNTSEQKKEFFDWNTVKSTNKKKIEPLLPSIRYFQMGSSIYKDRDMKSLFDLVNLEDIGKHHFNVELPTNAISLLANSAGYHFLTFASYEYQSRFSHNLYNTLRRAFIMESHRFLPSQKEQLLDMTTEFCRYMQQGIPVAVRFLMEYLPSETGEFRSKILSLFEWSTFISVVDLQSIAMHLETIFLESSLEEKCSILETLERLMTNLFVNQRFGREIPLRPSPFLGQIPLSELCDVIPVLIKIADHLITRGIRIHDNNTIFLSAALKFYEQADRLATRCNPPILIIAPPVAIYNGFLTKSCAILSRVCALLLSYRKTNSRLQEMHLRGNYKAEVRALQVYANALGNALWNDRVFSDSHDSECLATLRNGREEYLPSNRDSLLDINNHLAILPYKCTLIDTGLTIVTKNDALTLADHYYPAISEFIKSFEEYEEMEQE